MTITITWIEATLAVAQHCLIDTCEIKKKKKSVKIESDSTDTELEWIM